MTDLISDLLARLHNAYLAKKNFVEVPFSNMSSAISEILSFLFCNSTMIRSFAFRCIHSDAVIEVLTLQT